MKRLLLASLFLLAAAFNAGAQRISLQIPLSPTPGITAPAVGITPLAQPFPLALSSWSPSLMAAAIQPPINAVPIPASKVTALTATALPTLPHALTPTALAAAKPVIHQQNPKLIDSLREHGTKVGSLADLKGEAGAGALEKNFMSAASINDDIPVIPAGDGSTGFKPAPTSAPLLQRMLERVRLDDRGRPDEKKALETAFKRMLGTATGRRYAEEFLAEGLTAHVHFDDFPDSQLYLVDGRKKFYAAQAYTDWRQEGYAEIRLNRHYIDGDPGFMYESLPSVLGHELLGHGLWYGRAAKENLYLAFHYHELNETLARLVGWAIDHELDGRFEEAGVWTYLADPANYLTNLKMRLPYYAVTFSQGEMANPVTTLVLRLSAAELEVERAKRNLASQKTWLPVLEHFSRDHGIAPQRFALLRKELTDLESHYQNEVINAESIVREVTGLRDRIVAEPDHASEIYLSQASAHPFFERLSADTARLGKVVSSLANGAPPRPPRAAEPRPADQITWQELSKMYQDDVAADANRANKHWR